MGLSMSWNPAAGVESLGYIVISGCSWNTWKKRRDSQFILFQLVVAAFYGYKEGREAYFTVKIPTRLDVLWDSWTNYLNEFREGLINEDEWDEESKDLLGKGWDVANKKAALCCHNHQDDEDEPETDPHSTSQVLKIVGLTELSEKTQTC